MLWWGKIPNVVHQQLVSSNGYAQLNSFASGTANVRAIGAGPTGLALANGTIAMAWNKPYPFNSFTTISLTGANITWLSFSTNSFGMGNDYFAQVSTNSFLMFGPVGGQFSLSQGGGFYSAVSVGQTQILGLLANGTLMASDRGSLYQHPAVAGKRIISIASGANLSLAVDEDGSVHGWVSVLLG
jgi:alpha-tubulin suppressor-like RCC1 family protein